MLKTLADEGEIAVLLIEQNLGVAIDVADTVEVMVNGRIARDDAGRRARAPTASCSSGCWACAPATRPKRGGGRRRPRRERARAARLHHPPCRRRCAGSWRAAPADARAVRGFTRWNAADRDRSRLRRSAGRSPAAEPRDALSKARRQGSAALVQAARPPFRVGRRGQGARVPGGDDRAAGRLCRRDLRYQGPRAALPARLPREARPAHRDRRPRDVGPALVGHGASARGRAAPSRGRARRVHRRPRLGRVADGGGLRPLHRATARRRRAHLGRRVGRHRRSPPPPCAACRSACPRSWCRPWPRAT